MDRLEAFNENILPVGCDPKLHALTFKLRTQRHEIEQTIENIKKKVQASNRVLNSAKVELDITNNELRRKQNELEAYRVRFLLVHQ